MQINNPTPFCLPLDSAQATLELAGGKGVSLAGLAAAGLPVPDGFHVTTAAYRQFVAASGLQGAIVAAAPGATDGDPASLERAAATIQTLFRSGSIPEEIAAAVCEAYAALGAGGLAVAVRSSATAEDLPGLSFAGQQETSLNIRGETALLEAVRDCWASLWTARAIGYRQRMGIDQQAVAMAVVVQAMVPSEVAGVLFTAHPTTGDRDELVINASYGLGEAVVSGQVTPDSYRLDKTSLRVKEAVLGTKATMMVFAEGQGTAARAVPAEQQRQRALAGPVLRQLGELARQVEERAGGLPQDIEWAVADGRCWLLQARPMTGLPPAPLKDIPWEPPIPGTKWVRRQVVENMPEPLSPLFEELYLRDGLEQSAAQLWAALGVPDVLHEIYGRPLFVTVNGYAYTGINPRIDWRTVPVLLGAIIKLFPAVFRRGIPHWRATLQDYLTTVEHWKQRDAAAAPDDQLLEGMRALARAEANYWWGATLAIGVAKVSDFVFENFLALVLPGRGLSSGRLLRGFPSRTLEAEAELEAIAADIRSFGELRALVEDTPAPGLLDALEASPNGGPVLARLRRYWERYGHRIYNLDFAIPTQAEDPLPVLVGLKAQVQQPGRGVESRQTEIAAERDRLLETTLHSLDPLRRYLFQMLFTWAKGFGPYREEALFSVGTGWPVLRRLALELGRRLAAAGSLAAPGDVFFLETGELREASAARQTGRARSDLAQVAQERRDLREARKRLHPPVTVPPSYALKIGPVALSSHESQRRNTSEGPHLRGFAVSPGRVTAAVSVVLSPGDFDKMTPGTILVCPATTPAWTPLLAQARGLVTDIGGIGAHGSIIAREFGIPAVMGTGNGTQRIAPGQAITVDGDTGVVTLTGETHP